MVCYKNKPYIEYCMIRNETVIVHVEQSDTKTPLPAMKTDIHMLFGINQQKV